MAGTEPAQLAKRIKHQEEFEIWCRQRGNFAATARLCMGPSGKPRDPKTIQRWAVAEQWDARLERQRAADDQRAADEAARDALEKQRQADTGKDQVSTVRDNNRRLIALQSMMIREAEAYVLYQTKGDLADGYTKEKLPKQPDMKLLADVSRIITTNTSKLFAIPISTATQRAEPPAELLRSDLRKAANEYEEVMQGGIPTYVGEEDPEATA